MSLIISPSSRFNDVVVKTGNYNITTSDSVIVANATSGQLTLTLPLAGTAKGITYRIKKVDNINYVIIDANGAETIDGLPNCELRHQYQSVDLSCDGINWYIL